MNLSFENQLAADLSALAKSQQETGRAAFDDDEHCARVRTAFERVLVNRDDLRTYDRLLTSICRGQIPYIDEFPEAVCEEIVTAGIRQVDRDWIARLVLDPIWVRMLSDEISKRFPEAWWDAMHRDGARMRAASGDRSTVVLRRASNASTAASELNLQAAASPSCAEDDAAGEVLLNNADGFKVWAAPHPEPEWTTLHIVGRLPAASVVLSVVGRVVRQIEPLDENGYLVVVTADVDDVLKGSAELTIECHQFDRVVHTFRVAKAR
jgi:hypothetical protein